MMKYAIKNQFNQTEMQGNKEQIAPGETGSQKMTMQSKKQVQNQAQAGYMQSNEPQIAGGEAGKKNRIKTHSQSGRSMIEMLGVLAIVAILSIGGIIMFRYAMNYYQADQIAHEMNLMRTDAQIKIAQGTEKLAFGEPYDPMGESRLGHIQFNDDYPIDFACALADEEAIELSGISCHVANAYYIELQNIPEGVCRPLAELLNGLSDIIAFNVNEKEYPDKGKCETENENVLNAVFSAEAVSNLVFCETSTDCNESPNTPYCDDVRHVCVECVIHDDCGDHTQYCEENICITCPNEKVWDGTDCVECTANSDCPAETPKCEGKTCKRCAEIDKRTPVWNGEKCVECMADDDCTDPDTPVCYTEEYKCVECLTYSDCKNEGRPQCDEASHTCKSCADIDSSKPVWAGTQCVECVESTDCAETLVCKENICGPCETEEECQEKGENYHCSKEDKCIQCSSNLVWGGQEKGCVECTEDNDCTDTPDTPKCNTTANKCVECTADGDCADTPDTPKCNTTANKCVPCLTDSDCKNPTPICSEENMCVACKTNDECRLKNPSEENCVAGGACCDDPLMTWNGSECVCPEDYAKSETSSGQAICLPYCEENNIGIILMTDTSGSMTLQMFENANKAKEALHIPEDIPSAVYWCAACYDANCLKNTPSGPVNEHLSYGKHSVSEIRAALQTNVSDRLKVTGDFGGSIYKIMDYCSTIKEKLIIIVWWDNQKPADTGNDIPAFSKLKEKCPETVIYNVSPNAKSFASADKSFDLNDITTEYVEILNQAIRQEGCIERE